MATIKKTVQAAGAASLALMALSAPALADDKFSWGVSATGTSDYIFRGVSQSDNDPAFQAAFDVGYGIFYAGVWGSGVDAPFVGGSSSEIDFYAGIKPVLGPLTFDLGVIYYYYPGTTTAASGGVDADYTEGKIGVSGDPFKDLSVGFNLFYTDEGTLATGEIITYEGNASYALPKLGIFDPSISGVYGYVDFRDAAFSAGSYNYWNIGLSLGVEKLTFDFRYWDTDVSETSATHFLSDERFVFSASIALP
jgi:uncharacterized protein (TIGR02001 family)